jgi:hypothetical protein
MRESPASSAHDRNADIARGDLIGAQPPDAFGKTPPLRDIGKVLGVLAMERIPPPDASGQQDEQQQRRDDRTAIDRAARPGGLAISGLRLTSGVAGTTLVIWRIASSTFASRTSSFDPSHERRSTAGNRRNSRGMVTSSSSAGTRTSREAPSEASERTHARIDGSAAPEHHDTGRLTQRLFNRFVVGPARWNIAV